MRIGLRSVLSSGDTALGATPVLSVLAESLEFPVL